MDEIKILHSKYRGYYIFKVIQTTGRTTYDVYSDKSLSQFALVELGLEKLAIAKATIDALVST